MTEMPLLIKCIVLVLVLYGTPIAVGGLFVRIFDGRGGPAVFMGQLFIWALFQVISVPFVLCEGSFSHVVAVFGVASASMALAGLFCWFVRGRGKKEEISGKGRVSKYGTALWIVFALLLAFQLFQAVFLAYGDGDDAYYVAVSAITENADTMYQKLPYTGGTTGVDARHGLAPFPVWIAFLARVSGIRAVSVAQVVLPLFLIPMTYGCYALLGKRLLAGKKKELLPAFLIGTELLVIFGGYSFYSVEHFMIARSCQGKAVLGSIILPALCYLFYGLLEDLQENKGLSFKKWGGFLCALTAGCLCSTMGAFLLCLFVAVSGLCTAVCYRRWKVLFPLASCCLPCVVYALLYFVIA